jgi:phosphoribosylamine--glycine ligase
MKIAIIGSGGREHAIGWKLAQNKNNKIFFIPGNGGTKSIGQNINIDILDFNAIEDFIITQQIDMLVVGPEIPLVNGIADYMQKKLPNLKIIGPYQKAAMLEGSKKFAKNFMQKYSIPTAKFLSFSQNQYQQAINFLKTLTPPYVIKADGLAAGKGVMIINNFDLATKEIENFFSGKFGDAGKTIVIEQFLKGIELSVFIITDGNSYKILPTAKDYKRVGDNDTGLNTGGMGAVSPVPFATPELLNKIEQKIIIPTINGLKTEKIKYKGFLYFGLMIVDTEPYVIEYNCRMGDPETQAVMPKIKSDLTDIFVAVADEKLASYNIELIEQTSLTVVLASKGYPEKYEKNKIISGINSINNNCVIFHAGTKEENNQILSAGGRVLSVTCFGSNIIQARENTYKACTNITFENKYFRNDIGLDLV